MPGRGSFFGLLPLAVALVVLAVVASTVGAQEPAGEDDEERCDLMENQYLRSILTTTGERITYISGPVSLACRDGTTIRADSVVEFSADRFRELIGGVEIDGPELWVRAERVHLSASAGRTQAWGDVRVEEKEADMRMVGDTLLYLEANQIRRNDRLEMWGGRPYAVLRLEGDEAPDTTTRPEDLPDRVVIGGPDPEEEVVDTVSEPPPPPPPDTVFADRLYMEGRTRFLAGGSVRIRRSDLEATGDSLDYDRELSRATLAGTDSVPARIDDDAYDLVGDELDLRIQGSRIHRVNALGHARLSGQDVRIEAPTVSVFFSEGEIERLVAVGPDPDGGEAEEPDSAAPLRRPEAVAEDFRLRADSIEVQAPAQVLDRVVAVGRARGESLGRDSLNAPDTPESIRRDWIEGDTVVARFLQGSAAADGGEPADSASRSRLDRLVATGNARSLYRMVRDSAGTAEPDSSGLTFRPPAALDTLNAAPTEEAPDGASTVGGGGAGSRLAVHYVVGDRITITLAEGDVDRMEVEGQTRGLYLEPVPGRSVSPAPSPGASGAPETVGPADPGGGEGVP